MTAPFRGAPAAMSPFLSRLVLFTGTVPAWSTSAGYDAMLALIVSAMAYPIGFGSCAHGMAPSLGN